MRRGSSMGRARLLGCMAAVFLFGCSSNDGSDTRAPGEVALEESAHPPHIRCLLDEGFEIVSSDGAGGYELTVDADAHSDDERNRIRQRCGALAPEPAEQTDEEIRATYERWVAEAECLRGLGYASDAPPPFEVFRSDWRGAGPWTPIDGVDTGSWSREEYEGAKATCTLESFSMGW